MSALHLEPDARIEIHISCHKLKKKDILPVSVPGTHSHSNPCCVMSLQEGDTWKEVGRTEILKTDENPRFAKTIEAEYFFRRVQKVRFDVYNTDGKSLIPNEDHLLGFVETTISEVVSNSPLTRTLTHKGKQIESTITLHVEEVARSQETLHMTFSAQKLDNVDTFSKSDPFLTFSREDDENCWTLVLRTEVIMNNLNPMWSPLSVKVSQLCCGNYEKPIKVDCFDYESDGNHKLIGSFTTSVSELKKEGIGKQWPLINPTKAQKKSSYQNSGTITLSNFQVVQS